MQNYKIIDLTHEVHAEIPTWDLTCGFFLKTMRDYKHCEGEAKFRSQCFDIRASAGTHMDSPSHCFEGARDISNITIEKLIAPCALIDVSKNVHPSYKVSLEDINEFETKHGQIKKDTFVLFYTGWSRYWDQPKKYHNNYVFPSISADVAKLLIQRDIVGIGIDTLSPDCNEADHSVHAALLSADKYIIENVANADKVPAIGSTIIALPLKVQGAAESPIRLIALVP